MSDDDVTAGNAAHKSWRLTQGEDSLVIAVMRPPSGQRNGGSIPPNGIKSLMNPGLGVGGKKGQGDQVCGSSQEHKSAGYRASELGTF